MGLRRRSLAKVFGTLAATAPIIAALFGVLSLFAPVQTLAAAPQTVPYLINFQGKLTDNNGNVLSNGSYNVKFRLYTVATGGTNVWEEDHIYGTSDNRVSVSNGLFDIQLGTITTISQSLFNLNTEGSLYLEVELPTPATAMCATNGCGVWTEGAMTPRQPLSSSPYAINSQTLDGLDSSAFVQLTPASQQTGTINVSGNITSGGTLQAGSVDAAASGALTLGGPNATSITLAKSTTLSSGLTMTLQGSNALTLGSTTTSGGILFHDGTANNYAVTLTTAALAASYSLTLPTTAPTAASECLSTTSPTQLSFVDCSNFTTLQNAYDNSTTPANITLSNAKDFTITAASTSTDPNVLVNLQCSTSCGANGRFAVQSAGADVFTVSPTSAITIASSNGAAGAAAVTALTVNGGNGGTASTGTAGAGGGISLNPGDGGIATSTATGGAGGGVNIVAGNGGNAASGGTNGSGGSITLQGGTAGTGGTGGTAGGVLVQNLGNSTNAFQVQNASGGQLLRLDSTTANLYVNTQDIAVINLTNPTGASVAAGANTGGTLLGSAATTYYYVVTAMNSLGQTISSNETSIAGSSFTTLAAPGALTDGIGGVGGSMTASSNYTYKVTFVTAEGETTGGTASGTCTTTNNKLDCALSAVPTGPTGTTARHIYRTVANGSAYLLDPSLTATFANNTTTAATDSAADNTLTTAIPGTNTATTDTNEATVTWTAVTGATGYRIYRGTSAGGESAYQTATASPFTDTGAAGTSATPPTSGSAASVGIGTVSPSANLDVEGTAFFKTGSDSTTDFQIQDAGGAALFVVDSKNLVIYVGGSAGTTTPTLFVFGNKNSTGDPTGIAGSEYYNSTNNVFRCAEGGTTYQDCISPSNESTASQSPAAASTTYLTGSNLSIPGGGLHAGTQIVWRMSLTKTAAGTAASSFLVKYGTAGTTADATELTFTGPAETGVADTAQIQIILTVQSVSSTGTWTGNLSMTHNLTTTGFSTGGSAFVATVTSGTFADTTSGAIIGLALTSGNADAFTFQQVQVNAYNL